MTTPKSRLGKQHLIEVAERLFTKHGYQAVSIRDISQACGVTNAALYYHFTSKEALYEEAAKHHVDKLALRMEQAGARATDTIGKLNFVLGEYANLVSERRSPLFSLRGKPDKDQTEQGIKQHARFIKPILAPIEEILQHAADKGEIRQLPDGHLSASLLLGLFHGMLQHHQHFTSHQVTSSDIRLVIEIFWNGIELQGVIP